MGLVYRVRREASCRYMGESKGDTVQLPPSLIISLSYTDEGPFQLTYSSPYTLEPSIPQDHVELRQNFIQASGRSPEHLRWGSSDPLNPFFCEGMSTIKPCYDGPSEVTQLMKMMKSIKILNEDSCYFAHIMLYNTFPVDVINSNGCLRTWDLLKTSTVTSLNISQSHQTLMHVLPCLL